MSGKTIATIYFYLISAVSLGMIVVGIFHAVNFAVNSTLYDNYPLRYGPAVDCESENTFAAPYKMPSPVGQATATATELTSQKQACLRTQQLDRQQHRIDDIKNALSFGIIGIILFLIHFPLAKKQSKS